MLRAVVFDYGHTFVDFGPSEDNLLACYRDVRRILLAEAEHDLPGERDLLNALSRRVDRTVQESYERQELEELDIIAMFDAALQGIGFSLPPESIRRIVEMEHRAGARDLVVSEANLQVLRDLREMGLRIGLVSNAHFLPDLMREDIARLGIAEYVDDAVFSAEIGLRKPHPGIFRKVLDELSVKPAEAIFVGDRMNDDIQGAKKLGMGAVLTYEFRQEEPDSLPHRPDQVIYKLPELVPYVRFLLGQPS